MSIAFPTNLFYCSHQLLSHLCSTVTWVFDAPRANTLVAWSLLDN
jgi:hypothetical protein